MAFKGIGNNLAALQNDELGVNGNVATHGLSPTSDRSRDFTVPQPEHVLDLQRDIPPVSLGSFGCYRAVLYEKILTHGNRHIPGIARSRSIACSHTCS
jgi:hypothetical protein